MCARGTHAAQPSSRPLPQLSQLPHRPHPSSSVRFFSACSAGAGVTSSMPMEKPALPMKRALHRGREGGPVGGRAGSGTVAGNHCIMIAASHKWLAEQGH